MALDNSVKVEMPPHCVKVPRNGTTYIQYTVRAYRNKNGKPTSERVAIGKLDKESGMLIPNKNYYEIFGKENPKKNDLVVKSIGNYKAFSGVAKRIGLEKTVREVFGEKSDAILTVAHYMMNEGNVMYYLPDWQDENISYSKENITNADVSRLFASITDIERKAFFNNWMRKKSTDEYIAYDVTSFSSYGKGMESLEWGYNRDKEKLRQINFGMYFGEESKIPLYYRIYPGSIPDKAHLPYMMSETEVFLRHKRLKFVMDRGFYSTDNLKVITEKGYTFIIALPGSLRYCKELADKHRNEIVNRMECYLGVGMPYGKAYEVNELGFRMKVHMYYDPMKAANDMDNLQREIAKQEAELAAMEEPPDRKLHYDKYFYINRSKDGKLGYRRNDEAINKALLHCGIFFIAETDFKKTSGEILEIYRRRDTVEKSFDNLKNELDMRRLYTHNDETANGKAFCAFLALIVHSEMKNCLSEYIRNENFTFHKILLELRKIKANLSDSRKPELINPASKTVRDIFHLLSLPDFV